MFGILAKESGGKVHAVSNSGAAGPFQFMYHTGLRFGLKNDDGFDTRYDPSEAARANVEYLKERFEELNHNLEFALAAYNAGENAVIKCGRRIPPYKETETYVQRVLQYYNDYKRQM